MKENPNFKTYEQVALIYDHIMRKVHYDYWADYIYSITNRFVSPSCRVLELACGNCKLAKFLREYYPNYYATDLSLKMLLQSSSKSLNRVCCDMRFIPLKTKFDLIISVFDSVNYLIFIKDLRLLFQEINRLLAPNGVFTFDASLEKNSYKHIKDAVRRGSFNGIKYIQESDYNPKTRIHKHHFIITNKDGLVTEELHLQRIYPPETYFRIIDDTGLKVIECYDAFTYKTGKPDSNRFQFIVGKK